MQSDFLSYVFVYVFMKCARKPLKTKGAWRMGFRAVVELLRVDKPIIGSLMPAGRTENAA